MLALEIDVCSKQRLTTEAHVNFASLDCSMTLMRSLAISQLQKRPKKGTKLMLEEGKKAPAFKLPGDAGDTIQLKDYKGEMVVLFFYPKDDTSGCTKEAIAFTELQEKFEAAGAKIVGMSPDSVERHVKFKKKHNIYKI